jgi:hypothetical protein
LQWYTLDSLIELIINENENENVMRMKRESVCVLLKIKLIYWIETGGAGYVFSREMMIQFMPHYYNCMVYECPRVAEVLTSFRTLLSSLRFF